MNSRWLIRISATLTGVVLAGVVLQGFIAVQADIHAGTYAPLAKAWKELVLVIAAVPLAVAITQQPATLLGYYGSGAPPRCDRGSLPPPAGE